MDALSINHGINRNTGHDTTDQESGKTTARCHADQYEESKMIPPNLRAIG